MSTTETGIRYEINSEERANWLLRKIAAIDSERKRVQAMTAEILGDLDREEAGLRARFEADLEAWAAAELQRRGGEGRTLKLHQGVLAWRTVPASLKVVSPTEALNYGREQGWGVVKVIESLDVAAYRQQAEAARRDSGELIPGVEAVPERQSFSIRFGGKDNEGNA